MAGPAELKTGPQVEPIPPRYWWLKRITVGVALLLMTLAGLRWWWGVTAHRALQAEIDGLAAAGEPIFPEDFDLPLVPDDQNAALLLTKASNALTLTGEQQALLMLLFRDPHGPDVRGHMAEVEELAEAAAEVRSLVRRARFLPASDWGFRSVGLSSPVPRMLEHQKAGEILYLLALYEHRRGNDAEAVEVLRDLLAYGRHMESMRQLLGSLFDLGFSSLVSDAVEETVATLRIADEIGENGSLKPVTRAQLRALTAALLYERPLREGIVWSFRRERSFPLDAFRLISGSQSSLISSPGSSKVRSAIDRAWEFMIRPAFELDLVWMLEEATANVEAAGAPNLPEARRRLPPPFPECSSMELAAHYFAAMVMPQSRNTIEKTFLRRVRPRMAAVALAIRLYEVDHGALPETLDELVPGYLPEIPENLLADDGRKIGYRPLANPPFLYCIDPGCSDDNALADGIRFFLEDGRRQEPQRPDRP